LLGTFLRYTKIVFAQLARAVTRDVLDYRRAGVEVVGIVGIGGSPSCVRTTLDLPTAVNVLTRYPCARLDRRTVNEDVVAASTCPGQGLFVARCAGDWPEPASLSRSRNTPCPTDL
jgi:hypothetical protein